MNKKVLYPSLVVVAVLVAICGFIAYQSYNRPQAEYDYRSKAEELVRDRKYSEALVEYQKAINYDNSDLDAHLGIMTIYSQKNRPEDALNAIDQAEEMVGESPELFLARAEVYKDLKDDLQSAAEYYKKAETEDMKLAKLQLKIGDFKGATETLGTIPDSSNEYAEAMLLLAFIAADNWSEANKYIEKEFSDYGSPAIETRIVDLREILANGLEKGDDVKVSTNTQIGYMILDSGYPKLSIPVLTKVTILLDEYWAGHLYLGVAYLETDDEENAEKELKITRERNSSSYEAYAFLGRLYAEQNNQQDALTMYEKALEIEPDNENLQYEYAKVLKRFGIFTKAEVVYRGLDKFKGDSWIDYQLELANLYLTELKNYDKARGLCEDLVDEWDGFDNASPKIRAKIYDYYAWSYYNLDDLDKTEDLLNKAYEEDQYSPIVHYHLGVIFQDLQNLEQARNYYERAVDLDLTGEITDEANNGLESI